MSAKLINNGVALIYQPISDVEKGTIVQLGSVVGVVNQKILANTQGSIIIGKYWSCSRKSGAVFSAGDRAYVDLITQEITDDPNDIFVGVYISDNILSSDFVNIKFNEYFGLNDTMDFREVANYAALPVTGALNTLYITVDDNKTYRWTGSVYVEASASEVTANNVITLTNKRITPRSSTETSNATPSINSNNIDIHEITALAVPITSITVTGSPTRGQELIISIKDDGTARLITLGSNFEALGISLPTTTVVNQKMVMRFLWNVATSKWSLISISMGSGGGSSRADASLAVAATSGFSVDMITAQNLIITMDAVFGGSGLKPAVNPTVDGQVLEITFKKGGTIFQPVLDPAYFTDTGLDVTLPSPLLNATINTEDDFRFKWSTTIGKYKCVGFSRRYS